MFQAWSMSAREWRHNRCIMTPLTSIGLLLMGLFWVVACVLKFPTLVLGLLLSPCMSRGQFVVEFLYPTALGRYIHLFVCRMVQRSKMNYLLSSTSNPDEDKNHGSHSRTIETRIEVIPGRVYIHPLPQLLDNLGYLVVCCPETKNAATDNADNELNHNIQNSIETSGYSNVGFEEELTASTTMTTLGKITIAPQKENNSSQVVPHQQQHEQQQQKQTDSIVAFVVDCGDAQAVAQQLELISAAHYQGETICVQAILSTHKHHDHTAGNRPFFCLPNGAGQHLKIIVGGAVEGVPGCNFKVKDGQRVPLPKNGQNIMDDVISVEAVATPGHTRGSMTFILRPLSSSLTSRKTLSNRTSSHGNEDDDDNNIDDDNNAACPTDGYFFFTGDTMFSGGGGVPFEADLDPRQEENEAKQTFASFINASASGHAVERCFSEILARILPTSAGTSTSSSSNHRFLDYTAMANQLFILPGHEYTQELLGRQLRPQGGESCKWKNFPPSFFFDTASHFYLAMHRRGLPQSNGKLVTAICAPLQRELRINPVLRTLKRRADVLVPAILAWNRRFARTKTNTQSVIAAAYLENGGDNNMSSQEDELNDNGHFQSSASTDEQWNLNGADLNRSVFCTVYASDMEQLVVDLAQNKITTSMAARRLQEMQQRLQEPLISRRPLPGTLPSDRAVYRGLLALALLGSSPTALTLSDSRRMNLPKPVVKSSDLIQVSRKRLITVLSWLGCIANDMEGRKLVAMIHQLWKEASEDATASAKSRTNKSKSASRETAVAAAVAANSSALDPETGSTVPDLIELGNLKWTLYGVPRQQKSVPFCLPCSRPPKRMDPLHPVSASGLKPHSGELVRHDVLTCPLCIDLTGGGGSSSSNTATSSCPHAPSPVAVSGRAMQDFPGNGGGGSARSNNPYFYDTSNNVMRDDSANSSSSNLVNVDVRPVLTRYGTPQSEEGGEGMFVEVSSLLREV